MRTRERLRCSGRASSLGVYVVSGGPLAGRREITTDVDRKWIRKCGASDYGVYFVDTRRSGKRARAVAIALTTEARPGTGSNRKFGCFQLALILRRQGLGQISSAGGHVRASATNAREPDLTSAVRAAGCAKTFSFWAASGSCSAPSCCLFRGMGSRPKLW